MLSASGFVGQFELLSPRFLDSVQPFELEQWRSQATKRVDDKRGSIRKVNFHFGPSI